MRAVGFIALLISLIAFCAVGADPESDSAAYQKQQWPQFRGPLGTGVAPHADPPTEWSEEKNVRWKTALPGLGHSSPVVWGDQIFLTSAIPVGEPLKEPKFSERPGAHNNLPIRQRHRFVVLAVDRLSGKVVWETTVHEQLPHEGGHESGSLASASPVTDGKRVYAFFGSYGLFCLDGESGEISWKKDLGDQFTKHGHGEGASPALGEDLVVVNWDHEEDSFVAAFDKRSGEQRWRTLREEEGTSWATPILVEHEGKTQVIVSATGAVRGYELDSGREIWSASGLSDNVVATPISANGIVYALSSYTFRSGMAIDLAGAKGDLNQSENILWRRHDRTPYVPSPLLLNGNLYFLAHYQGILSRLVGRTGEEPTGPFRLNELREVYASPVAAAGKIYFLERSGLALVLSNDPEPKLLGSNQLKDRFSATPAMVGNSLFLRGERYLYRIEE